MAVGNGLNVTALQAQALLNQKDKVINALSMFRPTETQEEFFRTFSMDMILEILLGGGNRCLAGCQEIYDPVAGVTRRIDEIDSDFHVYSVNPGTGEVEIKPASQPFVKAHGELWRVTLSNGEVIHVTPEHRVVARDGTWVSVRETWLKQLPLASVAASRSSSPTYATSARSTEPDISQQFDDTSSSSRVREACHHPDTSHRYRDECHQSAVNESFDCDRTVELTREKRRPHRQSQPLFLFSTSRSLPARSESVHSGEIQPCFSGERRGFAVRVLRTRDRNHTGVQSREWTCADRDTFAEGPCSPETQSEWSPTCVRDCSQKAEGFRFDCPHGCRFDDAQLPQRSGTCRCAIPLHVDAEGHSRSLSPSDGSESTPSGSLVRSLRSLVSSLCESLGLAVRPPFVEGRAFSSSDRSSPCSLHSESTTDQSSSSGLATAFRNHQEQASFSTSHPRYFSLHVSTPSVTITNVTPLKNGDVWDISVEHNSNYILRVCGNSVISANSGKSTTAAVAITSFLLNQPVTFHDGSQHFMRPERWRHEAVKIWILGYDWKHIGKTLQRLLFQRDLFRVIRDQKTGKWRTWNPNLPEDADLFHITRAAPPLIRPSDIIGGSDGISWENKKDKQVSAFDLVHDGSRVEFFASTGSKPQGDPAHLIWMDEKIEDESWYSELLVRLIDYRGRLLWTTWPTTAPSAAMSEAAERAELQIGAIDRTSFSFILKGSDNPYTKSIHRDKIFATMDEDTRAARDEGKLGTERWRVYARFSRFVHRVLSNDPGGDDALAKAVREANGIPADWTRYLILDPGTANPAVLMVAIPPPKLGDFVVPYDELYLHYTPAKQLAEAIAAKTKGTFFEDFIIDAHAARQTPMGFDGTIGANYEKEFAAQKLRCRRHGNRFSFGSDNVTGRILRLQGLMNIRGSDGQPTLRVLTSGCPNLIKQLEQYKWQPDPKGNPTDQPAKYQKIDLANCLEYLVSRDDCSYVKPPEQKVADGRSPKEVLKHIRSFFSRDEKVKADDQSVYCGAGARPSY